MKSLRKIAASVIAAGLTVAVFPVAGASALDGDIPLNATYFPDAAFREEIQDRYDYDGNNALSAEERNDMTELWVSGECYSGCPAKITSLKGIEYFPNLETLDASSNEITLVDLSQNRKLIDLNLSGNPIPALDLRGNLALESLNISDTKFTAIDFGYLTKLTSLYASDNKVTAVTVSNNPTLEDLNLARNDLASLDLSKNTALNSLDVSDNEFKSLDVSKAAKLTSLQTANNNLTALSLNNNTKLETLDASSNAIDAIDLSHNPALTGLNVANNKLTSLDLTVQQALTELYAGNNQLASIKIPNNPKLGTIELQDNNLGAFSTTGIPNVSSLDLENNNLVFLDVYNLSKLSQLDVEGNRLIGLNGKQRNNTNVGWQNPYETDTQPVDLAKIAPGIDVSKISNIQDGELKGTLLYPKYDKYAYYYTTTYDYNYDGHNTFEASIEMPAPQLIPVTSIAITGDGVANKATQMAVGSTKQLKAVFTPANATAKAAYWWSNDSSIAEVSDTGMITAHKEGTVKVQASLGNIKDEITVTVGNPKPVPIESITITNSAIANGTLSMKTDGKAQLSATVLPINASNRVVSWSSSNTAVATVTGTGEVHAVKAGEATITATAGGKTATVKVTVTDPVTNVTGVTISGKDVKNETVALTTGAKSQLTGTVAPANATNKTVTWKSSNDGIAKVSANGEITAVKAGTATITASAGGKTASVTVTVTDPAAKPSSIRFKDVNSKTPHEADIQWLADNGISTGWKVGNLYEFRGMNNVVRQDMAAFLRRLAVRNNIADAATWKPTAADWRTFKDVDAKTPHAEDILWLAHAGISTGWDVAGGKEFRGASPVVRQDMAAFLHRLAAKAGKGTNVTPKNNFKDVNSKTPHVADIQWLAGAGVTEGWKVGNSYEFRGMNNVVRQDMAAFLHRLNDKVLAK